ncbi:MAG: SAM-dependent methyltransferase [Candidatus Kerfeldbacteria bacterium]|nr:SAM-dependent methyltransferase [Candidatus Kerfeldbacteria bacterium]
MTELLRWTLIFGGIILIFGTAAYAGLKAAPWLPVLKRDIKRVVDLAELTESDVAYDLGSGDGRILIALAHNYSCTVVGYEVSFLPYLISRLKILLLGLWRQVEIRFADFFNRDLGQATVVFCFLTPKAMEKLAPKFQKELRPGTRIISYSFAIPGWTPIAINRPEKRIPIFIYRVDARA